MSIGTTKPLCDLMDLSSMTTLRSSTTTRQQAKMLVWYSESSCYLAGIVP